MKYALITVYGPDAAAADNIRNTAQQVDAVYICDNSAQPNEALFSGLGGKLRYRWFGKNLGLSAAFNTVLRDKEAGWRDDDCILFFDQDSRIAPGHVDTLLARFEALRGAGVPAGCLGPVYYNTSSGCVEIPKSRRSLMPGAFAVSSIITSSMLTTYGILRKAGFWNERIFLDLADWDMCFRMQRCGLETCMTDDVTLHHSVGAGERRFGPLRLRVGAPFREYYQIRDGLRLLFARYTPAKYRIRFLANLFIRSPLHILLLDNGGQRMKYIAMGVRDFFRKKTGTLDL